MRKDDQSCDAGLHPVVARTSCLGKHQQGPEDAFRCFMGNELDVLVVGNCILKKQDQDPRLKQDYSSAFDPD